ncbi:hypothetical protein Trco_005316 [Trichoderma cornu-damae]|uniref:Uncharacterized protein n=1 Tax=Trichoderma cornu-damae TaxID=654480 RepID=A0A9P8QP05_9HYPO|nr:hypothetical protein Trco_005316 [Trichoderma cornu-damae]
MPRVYSDVPSEEGKFYLRLIRDNPELEEVIRPYYFSYKLSRLSSMSDWDEISSKIRDFMRLNEIEELRDPYKRRPCSDSEAEEFKNGLALLEHRRAAVVRVALKSTRGAYGRRIAKVVKNFKETHALLTEWVHSSYEDGIEQARHQKALGERRPAAKPKSLISRLKKIKSGLASDGRGAFQELAEKRDERLAELDKAMGLMQKHCVLIDLAQDTMIWDSVPFFCRRGSMQGKLWTRGLKAEHFTKLANGMWSVQMKWTAVTRSEWRPGTVYVDRRFGCYDKTKIDWVKMEPARIVSGPGDLEFVVDVRVRDELFYEEP